MLLGQGLTTEVDRWLLPRQSIGRSRSLSAIGPRCAIGPVDPVAWTQAGTPLAPEVLLHSFDRMRPLRFQRFPGRH